MSRRLIVRDEAEADITEAVLWYEEREANLGLELIAEIRAREDAVVVFAVLHAARHDRHWRERL